MPPITRLPLTTLLVSTTLFIGCTIPVQLFSLGPKMEESLDGNYKSLAACAYQRLSQQQQGRLSKTDNPAGKTVRIAFISGSEKTWELAFIDDDGGRQTRLEVTSANGTFPSEHILATVRACAA